MRIATPHLRCLSILLISLLLFACASTPETAEESGVLEPQESPEATPAVVPTEAPSYQKLMEQLAALGYEGMGLQFESEETLAMLEQVFSDPALAERKIRLVYTGLEMSYDAQYESITVGGLSSPIDIVNYIKKKVPLRNAPEMTLEPTPEASPAMSTPQHPPKRRAPYKKPRK